tara:strand:+ start:130 stop:516 length:387 start_codon:yes stop_codon:yes gene_type:complete
MNTVPPLKAKMKTGSRAKKCNRNTTGTRIISNNNGYFERFDTIRNANHNPPARIRVIIRVKPIGACMIDVVGCESSVNLSDCVNPVAVIVADSPHGNLKKFNSISSFCLTSMDEKEAIAVESILMNKS